MCAECLKPGWCRRTKGDADSLLDVGLSAWRDRATHCLGCGG